MNLAHVFSGREAGMPGAAPVSDEPCLLCGYVGHSGQWFFLDEVAGVSDSLLRNERWCTPNHPALLIASVHSS